MYCFSKVAFLLEHPVSYDKSMIKVRFEAFMVTVPVKHSWVISSVINYLVLGSGLCLDRTPGPKGDIFLHMNT
jgi:hypothetical protein